MYVWCVYSHICMLCKIKWTWTNVCKSQHEWKNMKTRKFYYIFLPSFTRNGPSMLGKVTYSAYFRGSLALSKCRPRFQFRFLGGVDSVSLNKCRNNPNEAGIYQYLPSDILRVWIGVHTSTGISCFEVNASKIATGNHIWVNSSSFTLVSQISAMLGRLGAVFSQPNSLPSVGGEDLVAPDLVQPLQQLLYPHARARKDLGDTK